MKPAWHLEKTRPVHHLSKTKNDATISRRIREPQIAGLLFFFLALAIAGISQAALAYDGSAYLFTILDKQEPFVPHHRYVNLLLHLPVLAANNFRFSVPVLSVIFNLTYTLIPWAALLLSWLVVREEKPALLIWPVISIGLMALPGQINFISEGIYSVSLFWPVILALMIMLPRRTLPMVALISVFVVMAHPFGGVLVGAACSLALAKGMCSGEQRKKMFFSALFFLLLFIVAVIRFLATRTSYEIDQLSAAALLTDARISLPGFQLMAILFSWIFVMALFLLTLAQHNPHATLYPILVLTEFYSLSLAGMFFTLYASEIENWRNANLYSDFVIISALPLIALAFLDATFLAKRLTHQQIQALTLHRSRVMLLIAVMYFVVLSLQSVIWNDTRARLLATMDASPWHCLSASSIPWLWKTPLRSWTMSMYTLIIQGRTAEKVVLFDDGCQNVSADKGVPINKYMYRYWAGRWFDFSRLKENLLVNDPAGLGCWLQFSEGWYFMEESANSSRWWRWSSGDQVRIQIHAQQDGKYILLGWFETKQPPDIVSLKVDGVAGQPLQSEKPGLQPFAPLSLPLTTGDHWLEFQSQHRSTAVGDSRILGLAFANLVLTGPDGSTCEIRP